MQNPFSPISKTILEYRWKRCCITYLGGNFRYVKFPETLITQCRQVILNTFPLETSWLPRIPNRSSSASGYKWGRIASWHSNTRNSGEWGKIVLKKEPEGPTESFQKQVVGHGWTCMQYSVLKTISVLYRGSVLYKRNVIPGKKHALPDILLGVGFHCSWLFPFFDELKSGHSSRTGLTAPDLCACNKGKDVGESCYQCTICNAMA